MQKRTYTTITWPMWDRWERKDPFPPTNGKLITLWSEREPSFRFNCSKIVAESSVDRKMEVRITLWHPGWGELRLSCPAYFVAIDAVRKVLEPIAKVRKGQFYPDSVSHRATVEIHHIPIPRGENFTGHSFKLVKEILLHFGIADKKDRIIGNFDVCQTSWVKYKGRWTPFNHYLRERMGLGSPVVWPPTIP